ncbi:MAG TPA: hypothetical protein VN634_19410 [Candidatus Limnocylindrales bacterium]|nr:hypothetical protein [Candidatus Limnocylindrales bacterium]
MRSRLTLCVLFAATLWYPLQAAATCGDGILEPLNGEQCDVPGGTFCCIGCQFRGSETLCRAATGACDVEEYCAGNSTACPANSVKPSSTICRESPGSVASQVESTRGPSDPDTTGTVSVGASSSFQFKIGTGGLLRTVTAVPSSSLQTFVDDINALKNSAPLYQRVSANLFNAGSNCQADAPGNNSCLSNSDCSANVDCATTYKVLLLAETRGADSIIVQTDQTQLKFATRIAGADDPCNATERCNGTSASCPADSFQNSSFVCRPSAGSCDVQENCPGNASLLCPADTVLASTTVCRSSAGVCDPAELCTGSNGVCPTDSKSTAICRASGGGCDPAEVCDGIADACPATALSSNGTVCRAPAGGCDAAETCDGASVVCPADVNLPASTLCRADVGQCDVADFCTGTTRDCPADNFEPDGTTCDDADVCTVNDQCIGGVCVVDPQHCGDGVLQLTCTEECDDGNVDDVDGCSSTCEAEPGLGCPYFPLSGCRQSTVPGKSRVDIRDEEKISGLKFQWRWKKGAATTEADFGDPLTDAPAGTSYTLCLYDAVGLLAQATAPAGGECGVKEPGPCWTGRPSQGFNYLDSDQSIEPDGVKSVDLVAGPDGRAYIGLKAEGGLFPFPSNGGFGGIGDLTGIASPLVVQLQNTSGLCFEATYSAPFKRQLPTRFQARAN